MKTYVSIIVAPLDFEISKRQILRIIDFLLVAYRFEPEHILPHIRCLQHYRLVENRLPFRNVEVEYFEIVLNRPENCMLDKKKAIGLIGELYLDVVRIVNVLYFLLDFEWFDTLKLKLFSVLLADKFANRVCHLVIHASQIFHLYIFSFIISSRH